MAAATTAPPIIETLADLLDRLGGVSPSRIRMHPAPGTATEQDVLTRWNGEKRLYELVDGVFVEKVTGFYESVVALVLARLLGNFLDEHKLGLSGIPIPTLARCTSIRTQRR